MAKKQTVAMMVCGALLSVWSDAFACSVTGNSPSFPGTEAYQANLAAHKRPIFLETLRKASSITLATAYSRPMPDEAEASNQSQRFRNYDLVEYYFDVVEMILGEGNPEFTFKISEGWPIAFKTPAEQNEKWLKNPGPFAATGHRNNNFWTSDKLARANSYTSADCSSRWQFTEGATYLVLRDEKGNFLSSERIVHDNDVWLAAVSRFAKNPDTNVLREMTLKEYFKETFESNAYSPKFLKVIWCRKSDQRYSVVTSALNVLTGRKDSATFLSLVDPDSPDGIISERSGYCPIGIQFLTRGGVLDQFWPVNFSDGINFTSIATQVTISDPRKLPIEEFLSWLPAENKDKLLYALIKDELRQTELTPN